MTVLAPRLNARCHSAHACLQSFLVITIVLRAEATTAAGDVYCSCDGHVWMELDRSKVMKYVNWITESIPSTTDMLPWLRGYKYSNSAKLGYSYKLF